MVWLLRRGSTEWLEEIGTILEDQQSTKSTQPRLQLSRSERIPSFSSINFMDNLWSSEYSEQNLLLKVTKIFFSLNEYSTDVTNQTVQYSTETHFKLAKKCRRENWSQRQHQARCLFPKVITLSASQPSSSKKPLLFFCSITTTDTQTYHAYHVFFTQPIQRCANIALRDFLDFPREPDIWRQARWLQQDCLMCHPKAYWKVSLFRTTTGEKFEIRYINVVRGEQEWLLKLYTLPTRQRKKSLPCYIFLRSEQGCCRFCIFQFSSEAMHFPLFNLRPTFSSPLFLMPRFQISTLTL